MWFVWDLGSQEANLDAFHKLNTAYSGSVNIQDMPSLKAIFEKYNIQYPNDMGTLRWAEPQVHPSDGRVAMPIPELPWSEASDQDKADLWALMGSAPAVVEELTADWFPKQPQS